MKHLIKNKNGRHHSSTHRTSKTSKQRIHKGRDKPIKRRIRTKFRKRYRNHVNPSQNSQSSIKTKNSLENFIFPSCDINSNNNKLELNNPIKLDFNNEIKKNAEPKFEVNNVSNIIGNINENNDMHNQSIQSAPNLMLFSNSFTFNNNYINNNENPFLNDFSNEHSPFGNIYSTNTMEERSNEINFENNPINYNTNNYAIYNLSSNFLRNENLIDENTRNINTNDNSNHNIGNRHNDNMNRLHFHGDLGFMRLRLERLSRNLVDLISDFPSPTVDKKILKQVKSNLSKIKYIENKESKCAICLEDFKKGRNVYYLKCNHIFHIRCLDKELKRRLKCPLCRQAIK